MTVEHFFTDDHFNEWVQHRFLHGGPPSILNERFTPVKPVEEAPATSSTISVVVEATPIFDAAYADWRNLDELQLVQDLAMTKLNEYDFIMTTNYLRMLEEIHNV